MSGQQLISLTMAVAMSFGFGSMIALLFAIVTTSLGRMGPPLTLRTFWFITNWSACAVLAVAIARVVV